MNQQLTPRINNLEPNLILDAGMEIWPEGTSRSVANNTLLYGGVLYRLQNNSSGITLTNSQQSSIPAGTEIPFSNQVSKTAAGTLSSTTSVRLITYIEGYDVMPIYKQDFSVIFWVKSSVAGNRSVSLQNTGITHSLVKQYTINQANTWELKVITFPALNTCPGVINRLNNYGLAINHAIVAGSSFQTATLNTWQAGNFISGVGEDTTWLTGTTHDFSICGVICRPGDWTSLQSNPLMYSFNRAGKNFQEEYSMTQRFFEKSYEMNVAPASITDTGAVRGQTIANGIFRSTVHYSVKKRVTGPTISIYNSVTGALNQFRVATNNVSSGLAFLGEGTFTVENAASSANADAYFHWVADARF